MVMQLEDIQDKLIEEQRMYIKIGKSIYTEMQLVDELIRMNSMRAMETVKELGLPHFVYSSELQYEDCHLGKKGDIIVKASTKYKLSIIFVWRQTIRTIKLKHHSNTF